MLFLKHRAGLILGFAAAACAQSFEAASVKPAATPGGLFSMTGGPGTNDPGRITYSRVPLRIVMLTAYDVANYQLTGPDWLNTLRFDITAKIAEGATREQFRAMLRNLLETRFRMALHRESREMAIYTLVPASKGVKIQPAAAPAPVGDSPAQMAKALPGVGPDGFPKLSIPSAGIVIETKDGVARLSAKEVSLAKLAENLTGRAGRPVVDRTGLAGVFTFALYFAPEGAERSDNPAPDLFAALQEQLGLRLEAGRGPVEYLVVDHAEKIPVEN